MSLFINWIMKHIKTIIILSFPFFNINPNRLLYIDYKKCINCFHIETTFKDIINVSAGKIEYTNG